MELNKYDKRGNENLIDFKKLYKDWMKLSREERFEKMIKIFKNS